MLCLRNTFSAKLFFICAKSFLKDLRIMERKRLRVDGIPTDIPVERVKDKFTIHFLRTRNGGREVEDIEIYTGPSFHAVITFEDDKGNTLIC